MSGGIPETCVYFKSGIGNLIQTTPALQALASLDPTGQVDVCLCVSWASKDGRVLAMTDLLSALPVVRDTFLHPRGAKRDHYKRWFVPMMSETSEAGRWVLRNSGGTNWPGEPWPESLRHEAAVNMDRVRKLHKYAGPTPQKLMPVAPGPDLSGLPKPLIGLCNGAFGASMWCKKHWPHYAKLARSLRHYYGGTVIGIGGKGELDGVRLDVDYTGALPILESARVIQQLDLLVTTDTACMHMADALGTDLVALFGPTLVSKNAPVNPRAVVVRSPVRCAPCQYTQAFHTCSDYLCMSQISPPAVMERVRPLLLKKELASGGWQHAAAAA